jgi:hypothetical protein
LLTQDCAYGEFKSVDGSRNTQSETSLDEWCQEWIGYENASNCLGDSIEIKEVPAALHKCG